MYYLFISKYVVYYTCLKKIYKKRAEGFYKNEGFKKVVYLDQINDPGNLGTIIRTALAFSYDAVILSPNTVSPYNEKAVAASKGAIFKIPVFFDELKTYVYYRAKLLKTYDYIITSSMIITKELIDEITKI